ncbi:accessory gene regulator B family protein [Clostridium sp. E02]|uniref:accessory gene regulator B family protein n=1 Tax=Clostridium sp. E02 TaxID=2487134 RepID=UPI000F534035|nr:accessory gene regulator B family protein [Clostridium sp. E02]
MSITKISFVLCNWMSRINHKSQEENTIIQYGIELLLDNLLKYIMIQLIGILIGKGFETFVVLVAFCSLRLQAGGIHAKTGIGCGISMVMIWGTSLLAGEYVPIGMVYIPYIYICSLIVILFCVPRTINIEYFSQQEIIKKKLYSFVILTVFVVVAFLFPFLKELLVYPVIIEVVLLLPIKQGLNRGDNWGNL